MKRNILILFVLAISSSLFAQPSTSDSTENYIQTLTEKGITYAQNGNNLKAEQCFLQALDVVKNAHGVNSEAYTIPLKNLGVFYYNLQEYSKSEQYFKEALKIQKNTLGEDHANNIEVLKWLINIYQATEDYPLLEKCHLEILKMIKNTKGENHIEYAARLEEVGRFYQNSQSFTKAEDCFEKALKIVKLTYGENHLDYTTVLTDIGVLHYMRGDYQGARHYFLKALHLLKSIYGENDMNYATALMRLGLVCNDLGDAHRAEQYFLQAIEIKQAVLGKNKTKYYAMDLNTLGAFYLERGDYSRAEQYFLEALEIHKTIPGNQAETASTMIFLGDLHSSLTDYYSACGYFLDALDELDSIMEDHLFEYVHCFNGIGFAFRCMKNFPDAEYSYLEALDILQSMEKRNHSQYVGSLKGLAQVYLDMENSSKAEKYLLEALQITKNIFGEKHEEYIEVLCALGDLYTNIGDFSKAEKHYKNALKIQQSISGKNNLDYANILEDLGRLYIDKGDYSSAEGAYLRAMKILRTIGGKRGQSQYVDCAKSLGYMYFDRNGNYAKAEYYLKYAEENTRNNYLNAVEYRPERQRELIFYNNLLHYEYNWLYPAFSYYYFRQKPAISGFAYKNELFMKGLFLSLSNAVIRSILESNDTTLINQWNELTRKKQQILVLEEKDPQSEYLEQVKEEAEALEKEITRKSTAFRQSNEQRNITWDSVRNHLNKEQIAIEYMIAPLNEDSTMYCALLLCKNSKYPELIPLFEMDEAKALINTSSETQISNTYSYDVSEADTIGNGLKLSNLVWGKILPHINPGETIYFSPSGLLHQLAIENLPYDANHTMSDKYNMVRLSSTREIVLRKEDPKHTSATLYGGIQYDMSGNELLAESKQYSQSDLLASRGLENDSLDRGNIKELPGSKTEVENINRLLRENHLSAQLFTSTTANEESFKALSGQHRNIIHIATHGFYWSDSTAQKKDYFSQRMIHWGDDRPAPHISDPLDRCGLLFAGAQTAWSGHGAELPPGVQDGVLTAKEISLLDLRDANLVVLSACETGKGEITGEGVFGLQRAFKQAGAQTIIMSLWKVNDEATQLLMTEFYRNWIANHQSKREAFRNAQNAVRSQYKEPYYWAGFIMLD